MTPVVKSPRGALTHRVRDGRPQGTSFDEMAIWASEILKSIKSELHIKLVYCSRSTTQFVILYFDDYIKAD